MTTTKGRIKVKRCKLPSLKNAFRFFSMSGKTAQEYLYNANIASLFLFCLNKATYINPAARKKESSFSSDVWVYAMK